MSLILYRKQKFLGKEKKPTCLLTEVTFLVLLLTWSFYFVFFLIYFPSVLPPLPPLSPLPSLYQVALSFIPSFLLILF